MFTHVLVGTGDVARARKFYDAALGALGHAPAAEMGDRLFYPGQAGSFGVGKPREGEPTHANGGTIGFVAESSEAVDGFHAAGIANGGTCEGPPGPRAFGPGHVYAAYMRDPDGNKICAICMAPA